jgi:hypothetical protein
VDTTPYARLEHALKMARAQRAGFIPSNRELDALMRPLYGRGLDSFLSSERAVARLVFAQAALMAGAALAADSATFFGAERLWRDMQDTVGVQERALARRFLELLSHDTYYSESERRLISTLGSSISDGAEWKVSRREQHCAEQPRPPFARSVIEFSESAVALLRAQRDSLAPSQRDLTLLFQAEFGRGRASFRAEDVNAARLLFGQVVLMVGALLAADSETYLGAEQLWAEMQDLIGARERALARRILDLLSKDSQYTSSERRLIDSLAETLST